METKTPVSKPKQSRCSWSFRSITHRISMQSIGGKHYEFIIDMNLRFITRTGRSPMALKDTSSVWDVYLKWHEYNLEKHDKEDFSGIDSSQVPDFD
jgi:hypothetical protein